MSKTAEEFGAQLAEAFAQRTTSRMGEVDLFRALRESILATASNFAIEELHGTKSHVEFAAKPPWTKPRAVCELADFCVVWFRCIPHPEARITFIQAKLSKRRHHPSTTALDESFRGNSTQWCLLHGRPALNGVSRNFQPPNNLLSGALLHSVGSFCIFHKPAKDEPIEDDVSFFYVSAAHVDAIQPRFPGDVCLSPIAPRPLKFGAQREQAWAPTPSSFGEALYSGWIGTPITPAQNAAQTSDDWHAGVRRWLGGVITESRRAQQTGPVLDSFVNAFGIPTGGDASAVPARSLFLIRADDGGSE